MSDPTEADRQFDLGDECSAEGVQAMQAGDEEMKRVWFQKAIDAYSAALLAAPEEDVLTVNNLKLCIGARRLGLGDVDAALDLYTEALAGLEARPDLIAEGEGREIHVQARLNRAECRLALGAVEEARAEVEQVLEGEPEHPYAQHLLGRCSQS